MKSLKSKLTPSTPTRARDMVHHTDLATGRTPMTPSRQNKENSSEFCQQEYYTTKSGLSPAKATTSKQPTYISKPQLQQYKTLPFAQETASVSQYWKLQKRTDSRPSLAANYPQQCSNHPNKQAEFKIMIDGECVEYCGKCSAHLASQGFLLEKLGEGSIPSRKASLSVANAMLQTQTTNHIVDHSLASHPRYNQIMNFLSKISTIGESFERNETLFSQMPTHYKQQMQLLEDFYEAMIEYLKHVKSQHLNLIRAEFRKYMQMGQIEAQQIEEYKMELEYIINDLQENIGSIVKDISEDKYRQCFNIYASNVEHYQHKAEQQAVVLSEITNLNQDQLSAKLEEFRNSMIELFGIKESTTKRQNKTTENFGSGDIHKKQLISMTNNIKSQLQRHSSLGACQKLFEKDQLTSFQNNKPEESPQFKIM